MTAVATPKFGRGGDAAVEADDAKGSGSTYRRTQYLPKIGKGQHIFVRYITDSPDWYYADAHPMVPTKAQQPADWPEGRKFPEAMPAVCRNDKAFEGMYDGCYICDAKIVNKFNRVCKPVLRVWAIACLREEVMGTQAHVDQGLITPDKIGKRVGFKDATREVDVPVLDANGKPVLNAEGKQTFETKTDLALIVVNQAMNNYFGGLQSMYGMFGTLCDRDFIIKQIDEGKDVDYQHIQMDQTANLAPGTPAWARYEQAIEEQGLSIPDMLMDRSSDEYYATFFDPNKTAPAREGSKTTSAATQVAQEAPAAQQAAAPTNEPDADALAAMRARLRGGGDAAPAAAATTEDIAAPAGAIDFA